MYRNNSTNRIQYHRHTADYGNERGKQQIPTIPAAVNLYVLYVCMVDHICDAAIFLPDDELHDLSWSGFVSGITEPELVQYLKERNLYVNEPVAGEGEA